MESITVAVKIPRCHLPDAGSASAELPAAEAHHVTHVLRLREGDPLVVFDGRGGEWLARIAGVSKRGVRVDLVEPRTPIDEPACAVTLGIGLLKGDQMSTVVRDATATGAAVIQPFVSDHVAVPADAWQSRALERWMRIAASSAAQCGRAVVPAIGEVCRFETLVNDSSFDVRIICVEPVRAAGWNAANPTPGLPSRPPSTALVLVGPEGGWSPAEVERALGAGFVPLDLGPRTLRAELAPVVALTKLWTVWGEDGTLSG